MEEGDPASAGPLIAGRREWFERFKTGKTIGIENPGMPANYQLAEVNIARMRGALEDPMMAALVALLDEVNALADHAPGFVWRFQMENGNATYLRPYDDDRILFNLSVWDSVQALRAYTYGGAHAQVFARRKEWFERIEGMGLALWWVPFGHRPSVGEGKARLAYLDAHGPSPFAFTFRSVELPDPEAARPWVDAGASSCPV